MNLIEFETYLSQYLNISQFSDACPNGLQIEGNSVVKKVATAVSANLQTIENAAEENVDVLIVHHGLFWNRDSYPIIGAKRKKIELLLNQGISLIAYHLPLDAHQEVGNNWKAAKELGWNSLEPFGFYNGAYIGVKGAFSPKPIDVFKQELENYYAHPATVALEGKEIVEKAALISGAAYREIPEAAKAHVDCFITGNYDEPAWGMAYEEKIHFLALGHAATEKIGPRTLAEHIQNRLQIDCRFLDVPNPF